MKSKLENWVLSLYQTTQEMPHRWFYPSLIGLFTLFFAWQLPNLHFNYNIEGFFSKDDLEVELYEKFKLQFSNENDVLLVGIESDNGVFNIDYFNQIDSLTSLLQNLEEIEFVTSPTNLKDFVQMPFGGFQPISVLHFDNEERLLLDSTKIYREQRFVGSFFSPKGSSVSLVLQIAEGLNQKENKALVVAIEKVLNQSFFKFKAYHLAGRIQTQSYYISTMQSEMLIFSILALFLFCGSIWVIFKQVLYVVIPLIVISISLIWVFGLIAFLGWSIDLMVTIIPTLIFVLSTSVSIHLLNRFREVYQLTNDKYLAIKQAFIETSIPNMLISTTTATGLISLYFIPNPSIQYFGLISASGIMISIFISLFIIPTLVKVLPIKPSQRKMKKTSKNHAIIWSISLVTGPHKGKFLWFIGVISVVSVFGVYSININNYFLDDLSNKSLLKQDLLFFENEFSGIRPFEMMVRSSTDKGNILDYEHILALDSLEREVKANYGLGMVQSPIVLLKTLNQAVHGGSSSFFNLPKGKKSYEKLMHLVKKHRLFDKTEHLINKNQSVIRISGRLFDHGNQYFQDKNDKLEQLTASHTSLVASLTGVAYLIDKSNYEITKSFVLGLSLMALVVLAIILAYTKSFSLTCIAIIVNLFPLLVAGALMGFMGIPLKIATAIIFTIVLGVSVDDTIHFMHHYLSLSEHYPVKTAVKLSLLQMTRPIFFTSLVLFSGFLILSISSFQSIQTLGWMTGVSLLVAMLTDLILLPILILMIKGNR